MMGSICNGGGFGLYVECHEEPLKDGRQAEMWSDEHFEK